VKEEDADWIIYHLIVQKPVTDREELCTESGFDMPTVSASIARLEKNLLIECSEDKIRALNIGEALIRCQMKYSADLPFIIENGVIKARKP
jgi:Mn-dependent DtxR family transcriptional regulator